MFGKAVSANCSHLSKSSYKNIILEIEINLQFYEVIFYSEVCKLYFSCPPDITIIVVSSVRETNKITELKVKPQQIRLLGKKVAGEEK